MSGLPGMPLPGWAPELKPCGTLAAYRRHLRRGDPIDEACRQAAARDWQDRYSAGRAGLRLYSVHAARPGGEAACGRAHVTVTNDPGEVTCRNCQGGHRRIPWVAREGAWYRAA